MTPSDFRARAAEAWVAAWAEAATTAGLAGTRGRCRKSIQEALSRNSVTGHADFTRRVLLWADASGRVTRVKVDDSKDDPAINVAIDETLTGMQLEEPPPKDMPMPIHLRFTARRPN